MNSGKRYSQLFARYRATRAKRLQLRTEAQIECATLYVKLARRVSLALAYLSLHLMFFVLEGYLVTVYLIALTGNGEVSVQGGPRGLINGTRVYKWHPYTNRI